MPRFTPSILISDCWGSFGDLTFYHIDGRCYYKKKSRCAFPGTDAQNSQLDVHRRALAAWRSLDHSVQLTWNSFAKPVISHRPPYDNKATISEQYYLFVGGSEEANVNITNCYYMPSFILNPLLKNGSVKAQGMRQYNIDGSDGVTVKLDGAETVYNVSGITAYSENYGIKTGIYSWPWGAEDKDVKLLLSNSTPVQYYSANHGTLTGTEYIGKDDHYTLNVSKETLDSDVTIVYISADGVLYLQDSDSSADIIDKEAGKTHTVVLGRTLKGGIWNSFCAPFAVSGEMVTNVFGTGVVVKSLTGSAFENGALSFTFEAATSIEAGKPYIIMPLADVENPRFGDVVINKNTTTTETTAVKFIPVINPVSFTPRDKNILFFTGDGSMSFPADDSKMNGFRAYIQLIGAE